MGVSETFGNSVASGSVMQAESGAGGLPVLTSRRTLSVVGRSKSSRNSDSFDFCATSNDVAGKLSVLTVLFELSISVSSGRSGNSSGLGGGFLL